MFNISLTSLSTLSASYFWFLLLSAPSEVSTVLFSHQTAPSLEVFQSRKNQIFTFTGNHATKLKRGNQERTSVNTDSRYRPGQWHIQCIWSEKDVGFIRPSKFQSDLTPDPQTSRTLILHEVWKGWVDWGCYVALTSFQSYHDLEVGVTQSLKL